MLLGQGAAGPYSWNGLVDRLSKWDASGGLALWNAEMDGHLAHERRRLRLIAVVLVLIGLLLALGHLLDHAEGRALLPLGLDDLVGGYPSVLAIMLVARLIWLRARVLAGMSRNRPPSASDGRTSP